MDEQVNLNELRKTATPEQFADAVFLRLKKNWYHLCCLDSETEYLNSQFEDYAEKQKQYADKPDGWQYRFYTQFLRHRD